MHPHTYRTVYLNVKGERMNKKLLGASIAFIVIIAAVALLFITKNTNDPETQISATPTASTTDSTSSEATTLSDADGVYSAQGSYTSPGGPVKIKVDTTITAGVISAVTVSSVSADEDSKEYIEKFNTGISGQIVGTKLGEKKVSRVSGSSLTASGFNAAIELIKAQASVQSN
jgi:hypothetical protein